jgi:hypothetical protein
MTLIGAVPLEKLILLSWSRNPRHFIESKGLLPMVPAETVGSNPTDSMVVSLL